MSAMKNFMIEVGCRERADALLRLSAAIDAYRHAADVNRLAVSEADRQLRGLYHREGRAVADLEAAADRVLAAFANREDEKAS